MENVKITLDTNIIIAYWKNEEKSNMVELLLDKNDRKEIDLSVTATIHEDIPKPNLSLRISELSDIGIQKTGTVAILGSWELGRDMLGDDKFVSFIEELSRKSAEKGIKLPGDNDFNHLHAHYLLGGDIFLTWDKNILKIRDLLMEGFNIKIMTPEEYLG